mmetsp:Transcript_10363/g.33959  ORF Transcript_10363/g.33959 Transcript_10363/m.33959 type:complete len:310 (+) Transcript_10363:1556-2485(+)
MSRSRLRPAPSRRPLRHALRHAGSAARLAALPALASEQPAAASMQAAAVVHAFGVDRAVPSVVEPRLLPREVALVCQRALPECVLVEGADGGLGQRRVAAQRVAFDVQECVAGVDGGGGEVVVEGAAAVQRLQRESEDCDRAEHPADGGDQRREGLARRGEAPAGQAGVGHLLGRQAEEEDHENVVDEEVEGHRVVEDDGFVAEWGVVRLGRLGADKVLVGLVVEVNPEQRRRDAEQEPVVAGAARLPPAVRRPTLELHAAHGATQLPAIGWEKGRRRRGTGPERLRHLDVREILAADAGHAVLPRDAK